jgi:hypothetical protein
MITIMIMGEVIVTKVIVTVVNAMQNILVSQEKDRLDILDRLDRLVT